MVCNQVLQKDLLYLKIKIVVQNSSRRNIFIFMFIYIFVLANPELS